MSHFKEALRCADRWAIAANAVNRRETGLHHNLCSKGIYAQAMVRSTLAHTALPLPVRKAHTQLGQDIATARKRRRLTMTVIAERAFISRNTLTRVERGDPAVALGIYATVLFVLGFAARIGTLADPLTDPVGISLDAERLPQRGHSPKGP